MASIITVASQQFDFAAGGKMRKRLREAILEYFPKEAELQFVIDECCGKAIRRIAGGENYEEIVFNVVDWLWRDCDGRLRPFLESARIERPNAVVELDAIAAGLMRTARLSATADNLNETIEQFLAGLAHRKDQFRYLNAHKEMHEVLHDLHRSQSRIASVVHIRMLDPIQSLAEDVAGSFADWVDRAVQCAGETEFPDKPPAWIRSLADAAAILSGPDVSRWTWAMLRLQSIASLEMGRLNEKLIDNAARLRCEQLIEYLDAILAAITSGPISSKVADLQARVSRFRSLCVQLVQLRRVHDLCQRIDDLLSEAAGLAVVTPQNLMGWSEVNRLLDELSEVWPGNFRIDRTKQAAQKFGACEQEAAALNEFATLTEQFDDLFHETDKSLLKVSNRIGNEVFSIDKELREFS